MTEISFPWSGTVTGDAGPYSDLEFSNIIDRLIGYDATNANYGVVRGTLNEYQVLQTSVASAQIRVQSGSAMVQGKWVYNDGDLNFTIGANGSGNPRIDAVVLRVDYLTQTVRLAVKAGTPAASPSIPTLTQVAGVTWEIYLARVAVAAGFVTITQANIQDMRTWVNLPDAIGVDVTNNSGTILEKGNVVVYDTPVTDVIRVTTSTTKATRAVAGIMETRTAASGGLGRMLTRGVTPVICDGAVSLGNRLYHSTVAGQATAVATADPAIPFGLVITANGGAGTPCIAIVDFPAQTQNLIPSFFAYRNANVAHGSPFAKIPCDTEVFDVGAFYDNVTNFRWTPLVPGKYKVGGFFLSNTTVNYGAIYKNGTIYNRGIGAALAGEAEVLLALNGSTDYVELFGNFAGAGTLTGGTAPYNSYFWGYLVERD